MASEPLNAAQLPSRKRTERRRVPRAKLAGLAYISFGQSNGGIVLNISERGLCFSSVAAVQPAKAIRFWFSADGRQIEAAGHLVWSTDDRKTGGLCFDALQPETRQQIRKWMAQTASPSAEVRGYVAPVRPSRQPAERTKDAIATATLAVRSVFRRLVESSRRPSDFLRGLTLGLLVAVLVAAVSLFETHRSQVGKALIHLGERFASEPQPQASQPAPAPQNTRGVPAPETVRIAAVPVASRLTAPSAEASVAGRNRIIRSLFLAKPVVRSHARPDAGKPAPTIAPVYSTSPLPAGTVGGGNAPPDPDNAVASDSPVRRSSDVKVLKLKPESPAAGSDPDAEAVAEVNSHLPFGKYLQIGQFRHESLAATATSTLQHLGFHTAIVPKHLLWLSFYQVLVGPYSGDREAEIAGEGLQSQGFRARPLPKRSREITVLTHANADADRPALDRFLVTWEPYGSDVTVKLYKADDSSAAANGRWVKRPVQGGYDALTYRTDREGSRTLVEIQFRGMSRAVVVPTSPASHALIF